MPPTLPACLGGGTTPSAAPCSATSVYDTPLAVAALTWSRTLLGVSLRVDLRAPPSAAIRVTLRPLLPWRRRGTRRFRLGDPARTLSVSWDLSRAAFQPSGSPEPRSRFSLSLSLDGVPLPLPPSPASRIEHVLLPSRAAEYHTSVAVAGRQREVALELPAAEKDARMAVSVDGRKVLQVKRLRWKFRGSEWVDPGGAGNDGLLVSWDVHRWIFPSDGEGLPPGVEAPAAARVELGYAVLVLRFDGEKGAASGNGPAEAAGGENCDKEERRKGCGWRRRSLLKTQSSSSSASSASSSLAGSSVADWASVEENELMEADGFSLVIYLWRR